jgi:hypothetical protein
MLIDPLQFDLIEERVALHGRVSAIQLRRKIGVRVAREHYVNGTVLRCDGELVGGIERRLRRSEGPGADAGIRAANKANNASLCNRPPGNYWFLSHDNTNAPGMRLARLPRGM